MAILGHFRGEIGFNFGPFLDPAGWRATVSGGAQLGLRRTVWGKKIYVHTPDILPYKYKFFSGSPQGRTCLQVSQVTEPPFFRGLFGDYLGTIW